MSMPALAVNEPERVLNPKKSPQIPKMLPNGNFNGANVMTEELVEKLRGAVTYGYMPRLMREVASEAADAIAALQAEVERLTFDGIHTCHADCPRLPCVQRREIDALQAALAARDGEIEALHKRIVEQRDEIIRLDLDLCEISKGEDS
jgi:hypothetical protein